MENKKLNIFQRMLAIENELKTVEKSISVTVGKGGYKAVSERDIKDAVKPLEQKYGVFSYPVSRDIVKQEILEKETSYGTSTSQFMRIETTTRFVNVDDPTDYIDITSFGDGLDSGDKAPGKASTYSDKYGLMAAYKISTGDDPDQEASPEGGAGKAQKKQVWLSFSQAVAEIKKLDDANKVRTYFALNKKSLPEKDWSALELACANRVKEIETGKSDPRLNAVVTGKDGEEVK